MQGLPHLCLVVVPSLLVCLAWLPLVVVGAAKSLAFSFGKVITMLLTELWRELIEKQVGPGLGSQHPTRWLRPGAGSSVLEPRPLWSHQAPWSAAV